MPELIHVVCRTNLDIRESWPDQLPAVPRVGDNIESKTKHGVFQLRLKVIEVTWRYSSLTDTWYAEVELHDGQKRSIKEFYEWYAPLVGRNVSAFI